MRYKDENKINAIDDAIMKLILNEGYQNLSISKIAKEAGVSQATIYVYYADKQAMLGHLYLKVKDLMDDILFSGLNEEDDLKETFTTILNRYVHAIIEHPQEAKVMDTFVNNPSLVTEDVYMKGMQQAEILQKLYQRGMAEQLFKPIGQIGIISFSFQAISAAIMFHSMEHSEISETEIQGLLEMAWDAVKK